jgi:hypothetical protein
MARSPNMTTSCTSRTRTGVSTAYLILLAAGGRVRAREEET